MLRLRQIDLRHSGRWTLGTSVLRPAALLFGAFLTDSELSPADLDMTPMATEAFAAYMALGPDRSLAKMAESFPKPSPKLRQLKAWSAQYGWQERLKRIAQAQIDQANEQRLAIWLRTLGLYDQKTQEAEIQKLSLSDVHGIHDRVRPHESGVVSVGLGANLTINIGTRPDGPQFQS